MTCEVTFFADLVSSLRELTRDRGGGSATFVFTNLVWALRPASERKGIDRCSPSSRFELKDPASSQRDAFYRSLSESGWRPVGLMTTVWVASHDQNASETQIITEAKLDTVKAAEAAGISRYEAIVHIGSSWPRVIMSSLGVNRYSSESQVAVST